MNQKEFQKAFEAIECEALSGRMSVPGALARVALLAIDYTSTDYIRNSLSESRRTAEAIELRLNAPAANPGAFYRTSDRDCTGGHLVGEFECSYSDLVRLFGEPDTSDGYKVSTEWQVTNGTQSFSIYDYKETCLYGDGLPTVEAFRGQPSYSWHIGGNVKPTALVAFLSSKVKPQP